MESDYGHFDNFTTSVCGSELHRGHAPFHWGQNDLQIHWRGRAYCFHANNKTGMYQLPSVTGCKGTPIDVSPPWQYKGPHMHAALPNETDTVTLNYGKEYIVDYIFKDGEDKIVRRALNEEM